MTSADRTLSASRSTGPAAAWLMMVAMFAALAPFLASGTPLRATINGKSAWPLFNSITAMSAAPAIVFVLGSAWAMWAPAGRRGARVAALFVIVGLACAACFSATNLYGPAESLPAQGVLRTLVGWSPSESVPDVNRGYLAPSLRGERPNILGTDSLGRDVASQLIHGCGSALAFGIVATAVATGIGVLAGMIMGLRPGLSDAALSRVVEVFISIPVLFVLVSVSGSAGADMMLMMVLIGCLLWTGSARLTRAQVRRASSSEHVLAARAAGAGPIHIAWRHILPAALTPAIVDASFSLASAVTIEASLSYLGLGATERPSWGRLLAQATRQTGEIAWWLVVFPGGAILLTAMSYNAVGDALRRRLDPRRP